MILVFHKVGIHCPSQWYVSADRFNEQLAALAAYDVVYLDEYDPGNPRHVVITFDGIYDNIFTFALPLLRKWGYAFELFIVGDYVGQENVFDQHVEPPAWFASMEQLRQLCGAGGRLQWHSSSHGDLESSDDLVRELQVKETLRHAFDNEAHFRWFAYPHGNVSDRVKAAVKERFVGALACEQGDSQDAFNLPRKLVFESTHLASSTVSVIIPNFNYGRYLPEAIDSVLNQSVPPDEILVIDDASTDHSREVIERYSEKHPARFRVVLNETNLGIIDNFRKAVDLTRGDYIAFLGADNRMRSDYVELCKSTLDRNPKAAIAYTDMTIFGPLSHALAARVGACDTAVDQTYLWRFPEPDAESLANLATRNFMHGSSMYRRCAYVDAGGYKKATGPEDHDLFVRILGAGWKPVRVAQPVIEYRQHSLEQANTALSHAIELNFFREGYRDMRRQADTLRVQHDESMKALKATERNLRDELAHTRNDLYDVQNDLRAHLSAAHEREEQHDKAVSRLEQSATKLKDDVDNETANARRFEKGLRESRQAQRQQRKELQSLTNSRAWRITKPLRVVRRQPNRVKMKLRAALRKKLKSRIGDGTVTGEVIERVYRLRRQVSRSGWPAAVHESCQSILSDHPPPPPILRHDRSEASYLLRKVESSGTPPSVQVSIVTYNSERDIEPCLQALLTSEYPQELMFIVVVDNGSTDGTAAILRKFELEYSHLSVMLAGKNLGFGGGHNLAARGCCSDYLLLVNPDGRLQADALPVLVARAEESREHGFRLWEPRQVPYEHPKLYDPVTQEIEWASGACALVDAPTYRAVGGFDENIFLYGEDVDLSWRIRAHGNRLQAVPAALFRHDTYPDTGKIKESQYFNSLISHGILRHKFGSPQEIAAFYIQYIDVIAVPAPIPRVRKRLVKSAVNGLPNFARALAWRAANAEVVRAAKPRFLGWNYELRRGGPFYDVQPMVAGPVVSVVVRTMNRPHYLREALCSLRNQTYSNIEVIVVEDGPALSESVARSVAGLDLKYFAFGTHAGRCRAGNKGLEMSRGKLLAFLDEDDLLFSDHFEVLVQALLNQPNLQAVYASGLEVTTEIVGESPFSYIESNHRVAHAQAFDREQLQISNYIPINCVLFDRDLYETYGGMDEDLDVLEDWDLWARYSRATDFQFVDKTTALYRVPANVEQSSKRLKELDDAYQRVRGRNIEAMGNKVPPRHLKIAR